MSMGGLFDVLRILKTCKRRGGGQLLRKDWNQFGLKTLNLELLNPFDELRAGLEPRRKALRLRSAYSDEIGTDSEANRQSEESERSDAGILFIT